MIDLFFMPTGRIASKSPIRDFFLFSINPKLSNINYYDRIFLKFTSKSLIVINIDRTYKNIGAIEILKTQRISFYEIQFPAFNYLFSEQALTLITNKPLEKETIINFESKIEVFKDAIVITTSPKSYEEAFFLIHEKNSVGLLIDNNLIIHAIIILNITRDEMDEFKENYLQNISITPYIEPNIDLKKTVPMENRTCFIKKIIELKNINIWHLLYYCYQRQIIDDEFLIDYAIAMTEQGSNDPIIIEMAGFIDRAINALR
jgi:hypothetical protein